jgi:hypothetical protein
VNTKGLPQSNNGVEAPRLTSGLVNLNLERGSP